MLAAALLTFACRTEQAPSCPLAAPIEVDLAAWRSALEAVDMPTAGTAATGYEALLEELRLGPLPQPTGDDPDLEGGVLELLSVDSLAVERGAGLTADRLVFARFGSNAGAESLRAQLLRPLDGHERMYCPLGDDLSHDKEIYAEPCLEPHEGPARSLALERLTEPDRDTIVVRDAGGWCGPGASRGDRLATSFWGVEQGRLMRYLEAVTHESWYESPMPPVATRRSEIELSDTWPRTITLTEVVECHSFDEAEPTGDCEPGASSREYRYIDNRYLAMDNPPVDDRQPK